MISGNIDLTDNRDFRTNKDNKIISTPVFVKPFKFTELKTFRSDIISTSSTTSFISDFTSTENYFIRRRFRMNSVYEDFDDITLTEIYNDADLDYDINTDKLLIRNIEPTTHKSVLPGRPDIYYHKFKYTRSTLYNYCKKFSGKSSIMTSSIAFRKKKRDRRHYFTWASNQDPILPWAKKNKKYNNDDIKSLPWDKSDNNDNDILQYL
jgi:hypothetical protein